MVQPQPGSRFPAEAEYRFRHALVRDAAYGLVPDSLAPWGTGRRATWLEAAGEPEPLVLAEHYQRGGQKQKAIHFFTRACKQISERQRMDLQGAQACLRAAMECEPTGAALTELQVLEADFAFWREDFARTIAVSQELLPKLAEGSGSWIQVVGNLIMMHAKSGRPQEAGGLGHRLVGITPEPEALGIYSEAMAFLDTIYQWTGQRGPALQVIERMAEVARGGLERERRIARGWWAASRGQFDAFFDANPWEGRNRSAEGVDAFDSVGAERSRVVAATVLGQSLAGLGEFSEAARVMQEGLVRARYFAQAHTWLQLHMAMELASSPERAHQEEAREAALQARQSLSTPMHLGLATLALARVALNQGAPAEAERWAREACEFLGGLIVYGLHARTSLSAAQLAQGRAAEARAEAEPWVPMLDQIRGPAVGLWLVLAEACRTLGEDTSAESALRQALESLRQKVLCLPDAEARERMVHHVPEHARLLQVARQHWGESWAWLQELGLSPGPHGSSSNTSADVPRRARGRPVPVEHLLQHQPLGWRGGARLLPVRGRPAPRPPTPRGLRPLPTSTSVPTRLRTMCLRNAVPSTTKDTSSPAAPTTSSRRTSRTACAAWQSEARKAEIVMPAQQVPGGARHGLHLERRRTSPSACGGAAASAWAGCSPGTGSACPGTSGADRTPAGTSSARTTAMSSGSRPLSPMPVRLERQRALRVEAHHLPRGVHARVRPPRGRHLHRPAQQLAQRLLQLGLDGAAR